MILMPFSVVPQTRPLLFHPHQGRHSEHSFLSREPCLCTTPSPCARSQPFLSHPFSIAALSSLSRGHPSLYPLSFLSTRVFRSAVSPSQAVRAVQSGQSHGRALQAESFSDALETLNAARCRAARRQAALAPGALPRGDAPGPARPAPVHAPYFRPSVAFVTGKQKARNITTAERAGRDQAGRGPRCPRLAPPALSHRHSSDGQGGGGAARRGA